MRLSFFPWDSSLTLFLFQPPGGEASRNYGVRPVVAVPDRRRTGEQPVRRFRGRGSPRLQAGTCDIAVRNLRPSTPGAHSTSNPERGRVTDPRRRSASLQSGSALHTPRMTLPAVSTGTQDQPGWRKKSFPLSSTGMIWRCTPPVRPDLPGDGAEGSGPGELPRAHKHGLPEAPAAAGATLTRQSPRRRGVTCRRRGARGTCCECTCRGQLRTASHSRNCSSTPA